MSFAAIVLAAGEGRRYGGPKATALLAGEPFLCHVVRACMSGGCETVWAVVRPDLPALAALARSLGAQPVVNPDPDRGMFSSVQCGVAAALAQGPELLGFLLYPVDHPRVRADTVALVAGELAKAGPRGWTVPLQDGRGGHPVGVGAEAARELLALPGTSTLRDALETIGAVRVDLAVRDPDVLRNENTPPPSEAVETGD